MNRATERRILETAKYLRRVRPIDPEEVVDYLDAPADPATVHAVLREHAAELMLLERPDGRFVPPERRQIHRRDGVDTVFPARYAAHVVERLERQYGERWHEGESGDTLREAIRTIKQLYFEGGAVQYSLDETLGYMIYHMPATYASTLYVLDDLASSGVLWSPLRVLDVGAGVGGQALALAEYVDEDSLVRYRGIEPSRPSTELLESFLERTQMNVHAVVEHATIEAAAIDETYDLMFLVNVLSELEDPTKTVSRLVSHLAADGTIVIIEPADERTSRDLRRVETEVVRAHPAVEVFAPTIRLWPGNQPTDHCWSIATYPDLELPEFQRALDEGKRQRPGGRDPATREFCNVDVQFSYCVLRTDGKRIVDVEPVGSRVVPLADTPEHIGSRQDVVVVKLSRSLADDTANPLYVVGDGSQHIEHVAVVVEASDATMPLQNAGYGDVVMLFDALVLWNEDEDAINLVVDGQTTTTIVASSRRNIGFDGGTTEQ